MSEDRMDPLDAELLALVSAEQQRPEMPDEAGDRLLRRLKISIDGDGDGDGAGRDHGPADGETLKARAGRWLRGRIPLAVTAFTLGGLVGAGLHAALTRPPPAIRTPAPGVPSPPPPPIPVETNAPPAGSEVASAPPRSPSRPPLLRSHAAGGDGASDSELAAERALVETARTAIARGDARSALSTLERAALRFPRGRLVEERESLRIVGLAKAGRVAEARALGTRFRAQFPNSMLLPMVDAVLRTIP